MHTIIDDHLAAELDGMTHDPPDEIAADESDDRAARGIARGLVISAAVWSAIVALLVWALR